MSDNDNKLLNQIKEGLGLRSETELANTLNLSAQTLRNIRKGKSDLSLRQRLVVADKIGFLKVGTALKSISPKFLSNKIKEATVKNARRIAENQDNLTDDALLIGLLKDLAEKEKNPTYTSSLKKSTETLELIEQGKRHLSDEDRIHLISKLGEVDPARWSFPQAKLYEYIYSSSSFLNHFVSLVFPETESDLDASNLLDTFKNLKHLNNDKEIASELRLSPTQISQVRKGTYELNPQSRLWMAVKIDEISKDENPLNYAEVMELVSSTEAMLTKMKSLERS